MKNYRNPHAIPARRRKGGAHKSTPRTLSVGDAIEEQRPRVVVLCGCGWGSLSMREDLVPERCPVCEQPIGGEES